MSRILVVEDDADQLEMRKLILEQAGHEVVTAQSAAQAINRLPGCQIVVMDLRLPTPEDGLRLIQAASGSAKIIVLSGADAEVDLAVDEFLIKPCSSRKLLETIARFCMLLVSLCALPAWDQGGDANALHDSIKCLCNQKPPSQLERRSR